MSTPSARHLLVCALCGALTVALTSVRAVAQETRVPAGTPLPEYARILDLGDQPPPDARLTRNPNNLPNIMITGYWPPTNEMLRQFSDNPQQNPGGWVGANWEGRGYNVYSFFPEFPSGIGRGEGDFEVDYQDTSNDWWPLVDQLHPIAIITFSRDNTSIGWKLEGGNRTYDAPTWIDDYLDPFKPTPELPIMDEPAGTIRYSSLPITWILDAVEGSDANVNPFTTSYDTSKFLSNFIGYHGNWYHDLHADPNDPAWNIAAGHIHVGQVVEIADAVLATEVTLRILIEHVDTQRGVEGDVNGDGAVDLSDLSILLSNYGMIGGATRDDGDLSYDGNVDLVDLTVLLANYGGP